MWVQNDWLNKHQAAELTGYNERHLTNLAKDGRVQAEKRPIRAGVIAKGWYFYKPDLERLVRGESPEQQGGAAA